MTNARAKRKGAAVKAAEPAEPAGPVDLWGQFTDPFEVHLNALRLSNVSSAIVDGAIMCHDTLDTATCIAASLANKARRLNPGSGAAEWLAPETVIRVYDRLMAEVLAANRALLSEDDTAEDRYKPGRAEAPPGATSPRW